jgi:hypothetical protein
MTNKQAKVAVTQNSVALSRNPKIDHTKWLGMKEKTKNRLKKILWFCSIKSANFVRFAAILKTMLAAKQTVSTP